MKLGFSFKERITISIDEKARLISKWDSSNFIGFYMRINKMAFIDEQGYQAIIFKYHKMNEPTILLFIKRRNSLIAIIINSKEPDFDDKILNVLDLL
jgi:hypothetical protein